jgi:hypothetical protein
MNQQLFAYPEEIKVMFKFRKHPGVLVTVLCTVLLTSPGNASAATDQEIEAMRLQLSALSQRLDKLEAENRALVASNTELAQSQQATKAQLADVTAKQANVSVDSAGNQQVAAAETPASSKETNWSDRIRWQGDFRYRYENIDVGDGNDRNRSRIRARPALIADVTPNLVVGFGLATGGDDPVSSNQTLGGGGSSKGIALDLAYFDWSALENTNIVGGKFKNFLYKTGGNDMLWDGDWRPEGTGIIWNNDRFFATGLGTWIESDSARQESFASALQAGMILPLGDKVTITAGVGYYTFDVSGLNSIYGGDDDFYGNSFNPITQTYLYDYEEIELFAELEFDLFARPLNIFADYVQNQGADENDIGYAFGFTYGAAKKKGQWEFGYTYEKLEADAAFGLLTNSDFGIGGTDAKGSIFKGSYALHNGINAVLTYYMTEVGIRYPDPQDVNRLQADLTFKYK